MAKTKTEIVIPSGNYDVQFEQGSQKAASIEHNATAVDLLMVPVGDIVAPANFNVRIQDAEYEAHVEEIKDSIIQNGFFRRFPLKCYVGKEGDQNFYYLTGGFTRFEAAKRAIAAGAAIEKLPVVVDPAGTSMLDMMFALDRDNTSNRLKPYERALVIKRAIGYGATEADVAKRLGISGQYVTNLLYLVGLPQGIQQMVIEGKASAGLAIDTARKHGKDAAKFLAQAIKDAGGTATLTGAAGGAATLAGTAEGTPAAAGTAPATRRAPPPRATGRTVARAAGSFNPNKKTLFAAIHYAVELPSAEAGIEWLVKWSKGDVDSVKELRSTLRKAKAEANPKPKAAKKANGTGRKPGRPKKTDPAAAAAAAAAAATTPPAGETPLPPEGKIEDTDPL